MPLTRLQKEARVEELTKQLTSKSSVLVGDFTGMDVATATEMRRKMREASVEYRVVKNSLAKLAMEEAGFGALMEHMTGPNGFVMTDGDAAVAAKIMVEFEKTKKTPQIRVGIIDAAIVTAADVRRIAELPSREAAGSDSRRVPGPCRGPRQASERAYEDAGRHARRGGQAEGRRVGRLRA